MKNLVIMNENHSLLEEQKNILDSEFSGNYEFLKIPGAGWTIDQMDEVIDGIYDKYKIDSVIFVSPIPYMIANLSFSSGTECGEGRNWLKIKLFHNDKREKVERNGKVFYTVSKTGWKLV